MTGIETYNTSRRKLRAILADTGQAGGNLRAPIAAFDADTSDVIEKVRPDRPPRPRQAPVPRPLEGD